jgi:hypothetical protein
VRVAAQGHEHLVQWLYCLYAADLAPETSKKRRYDDALLAAAHGVLQKLSGALALHAARAAPQLTSHTRRPRACAHRAARDRALPLLYVDAPMLPAAAMEVLEWLVGLAEPAGAEPATLEQRTLGLITLRDVVMHRKQERAACLQLVLRCTVHSDDGLRGKAIRMVVNQLHSLPYAAGSIEQFASERLESVPLMAAAATEDAAADAKADTEEALRRISLYFALCTRAEALLPRLFAAFAASSEATQPAFHRNMVRASVAAAVAARRDA